MVKNNETIILSLGGSLIAPENVDISFLRKFKDFILKEVEQGNRFVVVCGGGKVCRNYQSALKELNPNVSTVSNDWVGIAATKLNAELVKQFLLEFACEKILIDPDEEIKFDKPILIGAGFEPGHSTDYDTVLFAKKFGAKKLINLSNIECLYNSDPKDNPKAKKLEEVTWDEIIKILPNEWSPGMNAPFDPIAAKLAKEYDLEVAIISGKNLNQLPLFLSNKRFIGPRITN